MAKKNFIRDFNHACELNGDDPQQLISQMILPERFGKNMLAYWKLMYMMETANNKQLPDYTDGRQLKYEPWVLVAANEEQPSGFGFSNTYADTVYTGTRAGVRLQFLDREHAQYAIANWQEYKDFLLAL